MYVREDILLIWTKLRVFYLHRSEQGSELGSEQGSECTKSPAGAVWREQYPEKGTPLGPVEVVTLVLSLGCPHLSAVCI